MMQRVSRGMLADLFESSATFTKCTTVKVTFILLGLTDMVLTVLAMNLGLSELNPFVRLLIQVPAMLVAVKFVIPVLIAWFMPGKLLWPSIALLALVVAWNIKVLIFLFF